MEELENQKPDFQERACAECGSQGWIKNSFEKTKRWNVLQYILRYSSSFNSKYFTMQKQYYYTYN